MKKITKPEQLPSWFDINNYKPSQNFNLTDWYINIFARNHAYAKSLPSNNLTSLEAIWQNPIFSATPDLLVDALPAISELLPAKLLELSNEELRHHIELLANQQKETIKLYLKIDLSAPDEIIINELQKLLINARKSENLNTIKAKVAFNHSDLRKWNEYNLLPCIDLILYEMVTETRITDNLISEVVFPHNPDKNPECIRKTVRPMVENTLFKNILFLQAQVSSELANAKLRQVSVKNKNK